jgi:hypothetical protein
MDLNDFGTQPPESHNNGDQRNYYRARCHPNRAAAPSGPAPPGPPLCAAAAPATDSRPACRSAR